MYELSHGFDINSITINYSNNNSDTPLVVCLEDQSAIFAFALFPMGYKREQKENASAKPYTRASEPFYSTGFSSELSKFILIKNRENYEQSVSFIT